MNFPTNVKYTSEHEWIRLEGEEAFVGITDYAQEQLGDIVSLLKERHLKKARHSVLSKW